MKIVFINGLIWLVSMLHPRCHWIIARPSAAVLWHFSTRLREVSLVNIGLCYPDLEEGDRRQRARRAMQHYVRNILDAGIGWYWSQSRFADLFDPPRNQELLDEAKQQGRGVILLGPHLGSWELLSLPLGEHLDGVTLYKPGDDVEIERRIIETRERFGITMVPANRQGIRAIFDCLNDGKAIFLLPDQEPQDSGGQFAPFFGVPALTGVLVPRLVQRTGARVLFEVCMRKPKGRYQVHFVPVDDDIYSEDMDVALAALNRGVEECIALDPDQYLWAYKRFRARPEGKKRFY